MIYIDDDGIHDQDCNVLVPFKLNRPCFEGKPGNLSVRNATTIASTSGFTEIIVTYVTSDDVTVRNRWIEKDVEE